MGKTTTTQSTNQYTPQATAAQNTLSNTWSPMVQNPFNNPQYNMGLQQTQNAANQTSMNAIRNAMQNFNMSGMGNLTGGARASLLSGLGRSATANRMQGFFNNWNTAIGQQQFGSDVLGGLSGQLAGQKTTQKTSGLGTWLPQVAGAALGFAAAPFTGGASLLGAAGAMGAGGGGGSNPNGQNPGAGANYWNPIPQTPSIFPTNYNLGSQYGGGLPGQGHF